jgi:hypothetical protein
VVTCTVNPSFAGSATPTQTGDPATTWYQAETGKIPVSAGYRGPFSGPASTTCGPTCPRSCARRATASTAGSTSALVDIGAKLAELSFDDAGRLAVAVPPVLEVQVPFVLANPHFGDWSPAVYESFARAAAAIRTPYVIDPGLVTPNLEPYRAALAPAVSGATIERHRDLIRDAKLVQLDFDERFAENIAAIKALAPGAIVTVKAAIDAESHLLAERLWLPAPNRSPSSPTITAAAASSDRASSSRRPSGASTRI